MSKFVHVRKIEFASAASVSNNIIIRNSSCIPSKDIIWTEIPLNGLVDVLIKDSSDNGQRLFTTTIKAEVLDRGFMNDGRYCFRLTSMDGTMFLCGTGRRPHTIIEESIPYPDKTSDTWLKTLTVNWKSQYPLLYII